MNKYLVFAKDWDGFQDGLKGPQQPGTYFYVDSVDKAICGGRVDFANCVWLDGWEENPVYSSLEFQTGWRHACEQDMPFPVEAV